MLRSSAMSALEAWESIATLCEPAPKAGEVVVMAKFFTDAEMEKPRDAAYSREEDFVEGQDGVLWPKAVRAKAIIRSALS